MPAAGVVVPPGAGPMRANSSKEMDVPVPAGVVPHAETVAVRSQMGRLIAALEQQRAMAESAARKTLAERMRMEDEISKRRIAAEKARRAEQLAEAEKLDREVAALKSKQASLKPPAAPSHAAEDKAFEALLREFRDQVRGKKGAEAAATLRAMLAAAPKVSPSLLRAFETDLELLEERGGHY